MNVIKVNNKQVCTKPIQTKYKIRLKWSYIHSKWINRLLDVETGVAEQENRKNLRLRADIHAKACKGVITHALWKLIDDEMFKDE